jgi:hypothetical protein
MLQILYHAVLVSQDSDLKLSSELSTSTQQSSDLDNDDDWQLLLPEEELKNYKNQKNNPDVLLRPVVNIELSKRLSFLLDSGQKNKEDKRRSLPEGIGVTANQLAGEQPVPSASTFSSVIKSDSKEKIFIPPLPLNQEPSLEIPNPAINSTITLTTPNKNNFWTPKKKEGATSGAAVGFVVGSVIALCLGQPSVALGLLIIAVIITLIKMAQEDPKVVPSHQPPTTTPNRS